MVAGGIHQIVLATVAECVKKRSPMPTYLLVANQTLGGAQLREQLRRRLEKEPSSFYVLVPRTCAHDYPVFSAQQGGGGAVSLPLVAMATGPGPASDEEATALAQHRLGELLGELRQLGADADGELGHPDPLRASSPTPGQWRAPSAAAASE
jgi:hypothetical protein